MNLSEFGHPTVRDMFRQGPRLRQIAGTLCRQYRPKRPHKIDPESRRNAYYAMCCRCEWQREHETSMGATDVAMRHARNAHGDAFAGFVRVEAR